MKFSNEYKVRSIEMDSEYRIKPYHLCSYAQDAIACYLADRKIAAYDLHYQGQSWIISGMFTKFGKNLPRWRSTVICNIWIRKIKGLQFFIDFTLSNKDGTVIYAKGTISWSVFDEKQRRLIRRQDIADKMEICQEEACPGIQLRKIIPDGGTETKLSQTVNSYDIDFNGHLNSIRYIAGALETIPTGYRQNNKLLNLHIKYSKEAILDDTITCKCSQSDASNDYYHHLYDQNGNDVALMNSSWIHEE